MRQQKEEGLRHIYTGISHSSASEGLKTVIPVFTYPSEAELCEERVRRLSGIANTPVF